MPLRVSGLGTMTFFAAVDVSGVVLGGSGNRRQTFQASGRAWRVNKKRCGLLKTRCFRCGCPKGHDPQNLGPTCWTHGQASPKVDTNESCRNHQPAPPRWPHWPSHASASGSVHPFPAGRFDWLIAVSATGYESGGLPKVQVL